MTKNVILPAVVAVVAVVVSLVGLAVLQPEPTIVERPVGSASSPSVVEGCIDINGVQTCQYSQGVKTATTTVCSFRSPRFATSTLARATLNLRTASSSATSVLFAKDTTNPTASTTALSAIQSVGATQALPFVLTGAGDLSGPTTTVANSNHIFAPGTYLNISMQGGDNPGGNLTGFTPAGNCSATFEVLQGS